MDARHGAKDSPSKEEQAENARNRSGRPASARSGATHFTQQTVKTMNQTNFTGSNTLMNTEQQFGKHYQQSLLSKLTDASKLADLLAEDTTLGRDQNMGVKDSRSAQV